MAAAIKTLSELGGLMGRNAAAQEERLLSFLAVYQAANNGATPSYAVMAGQLDLLEPGIRVLLARLENKGKIHFVSKNPPRIMLIGADTVLPHEPGPGDKGLAKEGAYGRFLDAEAERHRLGRFIASQLRDKGHAPTLADMVDFVGFGGPAYVNRMAEMLAEKGVIQYGRGVPTKLTELGRRLYGLKEGVEMEQVKTDAKGRVIVIPKRPRGQRVREMCESLADFKRGGKEPRYEDLAVAIGFSANSSGAISEFVREATRKGWLEHKPRTQRKLTFTEKGKAKFMPETVGQGRPVEVGFTDRVAPDSPLRAAAARAFQQPDPAMQRQADLAAMVRADEEAGLYAASERVPYAPSALHLVETPALIMELIERGYTVRKG